MESIHRECKAVFHVEQHFWKKGSFKELIYLWKIFMPATIIKNNSFQV